MRINRGSVLKNTKGFEEPVSFRKKKTQKVNKIKGREGIQILTFPGL